MIAAALWLDAMRRGAVAAFVLVVPTLLVFVWMSIVMPRRYKRQFRHGRRRDR